LHALLCAVTSTLLTACPPRSSPAYVVAYNNSGVDQSVKLASRRVAWPAGATLRIYEDAKRSERSIDWEELSYEGSRGIMLYLSSAEHSAGYHWVFGVEGHTQKTRVFAQLEADGHICRVPTGSSFPVKRSSTNESCVAPVVKRIAACASGGCVGATR
jgi:hypothetical protein